MTHKIHYRLMEHQDVDVKVFQSKTIEFLGKEFTFNIIGSSHCITCRDHNFMELFSCDDKHAAVCNNYIIEGEKETVFENNFLKCKNITTISDLQEYEKKFDLFHDFGSGGCTGIKINEHSFETIHTYPEHNKIILTKSEFELK